MGKSPLKASPLHNPGESIEAEIQRIVDDEVSKYALFGVFWIVLALMEWLKWYLESPPSPIIYTAITVLVTPYCIFKLSRLRRQLKRLKLGRDGEKAVGQYLEELRSKGCRVLHDIVGSGFNADHVVLSQNGIFVIETKTLSKPEKGEAKVTVSDDHILVRGKMMERDPIVQVKAAASWIGDILKESAGKAYPIKPVVVFPGWFVEGKHKDVWVLNPKALPTFIENEKTVLKPEDVQLATYHLARYIRSVK